MKRICSSYNKASKTELSPEEPTFHSPKKRRRLAPVTNFDEFDQRVLRRTVLEFYARREIPTLHKIKEELTEKISYGGCIESLRKVLLKIGFKFAKVDGRKFLMRDMM